MEYTKHLESVCLYYYYYYYYYYILLLFFPIRLGILWANIRERIQKKYMKICTRKLKSCVYEVQQEVKYIQHMY
jgi:hypothetical protein